MVYVFLADGFEEIEALTPVDLLRRAEQNTKTVSIYEDRIKVTGARRIEVCADTTMDKVTLQKDDIIVLPGGMPGTANLLACEPLMKMVEEHDASGGRIAAICAAPAKILGTKGLVRGKRATCYPGLEGLLDGATFVTDPVVTDGNITTSRGLGTAVDLACELITILCGSEKASQIRSSVVA